MRLGWRASWAAATVIAAGMIFPSIASATISVSMPISFSTYVNSVPVVWSTTTTPTSISMVWTCTAGYCLNTVTSPITLDLVSTSTHGSFSYNPSAATNTNFSNWPGPIPDGTWTVQMKYVDSTTVTFASTVVTHVQVSTATAPPTLTGLSSNTATNLTSIPVSYALPSTPSTTVHPTLTFTNTATSVASVLELPTTASGSFNLDVANLSATSSVLAVTGPDDLTGGSYDVALTYQDTYSHPSATTSELNWTFDPTTQPPSLSAPTGGSQTGPFDLSFDLPEAALPNSVRLIIAGGPTPITLSLADTTAGTHTISLDPADLAADSDVLSSSASTLAPGSYTVTLAYQDALGNPVSSSSPAPLTIASPVTTTPSTTTSPSPSPSPTTTTTTTTAAPTATAGPVATPPVATPSPDPVTTPVATTSGTTEPPCRAATGRVIGRLLGRIVLGMHRHAIHHAFSNRGTAGSSFDRCSGGSGTLTVGYSMGSYLHELTARQRRWVRGRAVLILTTIAGQWIDHMHAGMRLAAARHSLTHARRFRRGHTIWYAIHQRRRTVVVSVTHGTVRQVGLAAPILTRTRRQERLLLARL